MKKFTLGLLGLIIISLFCVIIYNYIYDQSGLFNKDFSKKMVQPSQHIVKMQYLLKNIDKYNAFCFGSSTIGQLNLNLANDNYNYYNMTYPRGIPKEWLDDIKILLNNHVTISRLMIGIDPYDFSTDPKIHMTDYLMVPYPKNKAHLRKIYMMFLLKQPTQLTSPMLSIYDIYNTGATFRIDDEKYIREHYDTYKTDLRFRNQGIGVQNYPMEQEALESIRQIKEIAYRNHIKITFFITPSFKSFYLYQNITEFNNIKRKLAQITCYYDFSGLDNITKNEYNFYDWVHYRPNIGNLMMHRMFYTIPQENNQNFGFYVTPDNVEKHITDLNNELKYMK